MVLFIQRNILNALDYIVKNFQNLRASNYYNHDLIVFSFLFISHYLIHVSAPQISVGYHSKGPHPVLKVDVLFSHNLKRLYF